MTKEFSGNIQRLYLSDVTTGLIASLAERDVKSLDADPQRWAHAFKNMVPTIERLAKQKKLRLGFSITPHEIYGVSEELDEEIIKMVKTGIVLGISIPWDKKYDIRIRRDETKQIFRNLLFSREEYSVLADEFLKYYKEYIPPHRIV